MKIVAISDTHCLHDKIQLPKGNILIHAGDACSSGTQQEFENFVKWFAKQTFEHKIFVAGNHDRWVESNTREARQLLDDHGILYLQDGMVTISGVSIWGSPWVPAFCNWAFNADDRQLNLAADAIPENIDVLVTHTPPYGVLDEGLRYGYDHPHIGSAPLIRRLSSLRQMAAAPHYHIFGHNHCGSGVTWHQGRVAANVAQVNERYEIAYPPVVFDLNF